jgi:hypothetical protein
MCGTYPPVLWKQNPCFHELTGMVALQNIQKKELRPKSFRIRSYALFRPLLAAFGRKRTPGRWEKNS